MLLREAVPPRGPTRTLAVATLVNTLGNGLFMTGSAIFLTRSVGLTPGEVAVGLTVAGVVGMLAAYPAGILAERLGARGVLAAMTALEGAVMTAYTVVHSFAVFLLVAIGEVVLDRATGAVRGGIVANVLPPDQRVRGRAYLRSLTNVGISGGALLAGIALHVDTRPAYLALILGDAATFLVAALVFLRLPAVPVVRRTKGEPMLRALRDRPYVAVVALYAMISLHFSMLELGVPIWVSQHTDAPRSVVSLVFLVNTVGVVTLQVRASRGTEDVAGAVRACRRAGWLLGAAALLYGAAAWGDAAVATAVLVLGAVAHMLGEVISSAATWGLGFALAPPDRQGEYQGLFSTGLSAAFLLGPIVVVPLGIGLGVVGWVLLGVIWVAAGFAAAPVAGWAARSRAREGLLTSASG